MAARTFEAYHPAPPWPVATSSAFRPSALRRRGAECVGDDLHRHRPWIQAIQPRRAPGDSSTAFVRIVIAARSPATHASAPNRDPNSGRAPSDRVADRTSRADQTRAARRRFRHAPVWIRSPGIPVPRATPAPVVAAVRGAVVDLSPSPSLSGSHQVGGGYVMGPAGSRSPPFTRGRALGHRTRRGCGSCGSTEAADGMSRRRRGHR